MQAPVLRVVKEVRKFCRRNIGLTAPCLQSDPIQQLFVEKLREYRKKSEGGKLVDVSPEVEKEMKNDLYRIEKQFGATGVDMSKFPTLKFEEPKYDSINVKEN